MSGLVRMAIDRYVNLVDSISGEWHDTELPFKCLSPGGLVTGNFILKTTEQYAPLLCIQYRYSKLRNAAMFVNCNTMLNTELVCMCTVCHTTNSNVSLLYLYTKLNAMCINRVTAVNVSHSAKS
jgi:hypothetical protein